MSLTDGKIRRAYREGMVAMATADVKRAYERLRKRSYRMMRRNLAGTPPRIWHSQHNAERQAHAAYVEGLRDMANAIGGRSR